MTLDVGGLLALLERRLPGEAPRREAEWLLEHALDVNRAWLFAHADATLAPTAVRRCLALAERRARGEPLAYVLGRTGFWSLDLEISPDTLIPRAETECLVEAALERLAPGVELHVADLGTGSGAIALTLARERPAARVVATDRSHGALQVAIRNASRLRLGNVEFRQGHWFEPLANGRFDLIASNPPYVADDDPHLGQGDLRFEPRTALVGGPDGLDPIRHLAGRARDFLKPGGWLLLEHGHQQGAAVRELLERAGFAAVATQRDLEGRERVSLGQSPG